MPIRALWNRLANDSRGVAALEFAFFLPILLVLAGGIFDVGRALYQAETVDKALRDGAIYAAHLADPFSATAETAVENLVKTGNPDGTGDYLVSGFADASASVSVTSLSYDLDGTSLPVIKVSAQVPFDPLFPVLFSLFDPSLFTIRLSHEQAYIGP